MRLPSTNPITLAYGATSPPYSASAPHAGTDYAGGDLNSYAPEDVKIVDYFPYDGVNPCGNQLDMVSLDGKRKYRFCHSSKILCSVGQTYKEGTVLAIEGAVGLAFGVHLHFVMWVDGVRVDGDKTIKQMIGDNMAIDRGRAIRLLRIYLHKNPTENQILKLMPQQEDTWLDAARLDPGFADQTKKIEGYDALLAENAQLKKQINAGGTVLAPGQYKVI